MVNPYANSIINRKTGSNTTDNHKLVKRDIVDTSGNQLFDQHLNTEDNEPNSSHQKVDQTLDIVEANLVELTAKPTYLFA